MLLAALLRSQSSRAVRTQQCGREAAERGCGPRSAGRVQVINLPHLDERINKGSFLMVLMEGEVE